MTEEVSQPGQPPDETSLPEFRFEDQTVRTEIRDGEPWFVANDVCAVLGLANPRDAIADFDDDEKGVGKSDTNRGLRNVSVISESGLYRLIFQSSKPTAQRFRKWVTSEVLPTIRKTGRYERRPNGDNVSAETTKFRLTPEDLEADARTRVKLLCAKVEEIYVRWERYFDEFVEVSAIHTETVEIGKAFSEALPRRASKERTLSLEELLRQPKRRNLTDDAIQKGKLLAVKLQEVEVRWDQFMGDMEKFQRAIFASKDLADTLTKAVGYAR
jgi:prophage antirepressor-like protein